jgi:uncharacterized membrane protein YbhN (UPF0104 family)
LLRLIFGTALFAFVLASLARNWDDMRSALENIGFLQLLIAGCLVLMGLALSVGTWRCAMGELGHRIPVAAASKIYLLGQLGKYAPGSVWAVAVQADLARPTGASRFSTVAAGVVAIAVNGVVGLTLGFALVPSLLGFTWQAAGLAALAIVAVLALNPRVLTRVVNVGLRLLGRPPLERPTSWRGVLEASGWSIASCSCYGLSVWLLAVSVGAGPAAALPLSVAGTALAMTVGVLVFVAPSGLGVREGIIVASLAPVLDRPDALAVAIVARLLFTIADAVAAVCVVPLRIQPSRTPQEVPMPLRLTGDAARQRAPISQANPEEHS